MSNNTASDVDVPEFPQKLCQYEDHVLRMTYEYFQEDLLYIVENLSCQALLSELSSQNVLDVEKYKSLEDERKTFARTLLKDISDRGREAVIGLWVSLHALRKYHLYPGLGAVLEELHHRGDTLVEQIILDKDGHQLTEALKDAQDRHKKHLHEQTEKLLENKPPGSNQGEERFPFCTRYVNLTVVSTDHFRKRSENELIETGKRHEEYLTEKELQRIFPNKLFRWCHRSKLVPHMVMVSGVPGVGKTTLMQKFVYDWVKSDLYQRFSFVFFFKFRELNRMDEVSLETMILHQYPYLQEQLGNILQDPEKLLFIFDGLDESNHEMDFTSRQHLCSNPKQPEHCGQIVVSLVRKSLLSGCSVLMTSRPTRLASIDCNVFQRIVEITGFFPEERKIYFENFFPDPELAQKAFNYVKQNDTLYTFCYLPSYCWIICTVLSKSFQPTSTDQPASLLPKTVTQLFAIFVANILSNHSLEKSDAQKLLQSIGWMAEHGVINQMIVFDEQDLVSFHVDNKSKLLSSFLMESEEPVGVAYSFLHLTVQEFFSALVHYTDYSPEKLQESLRKAKSSSDGCGEIFLRFLCGLSDCSTRSYLTGYLGALGAPASKDVITWLKNFIPEEQTLREKKDMKRRLLGTFYYLFETRNKLLVQEVLKSHRRFDFSYIHMSALDCTVLAFIIKSCANIEELNLSGCSIDTEGLGRLAPTLKNLSYLRSSSDRWESATWDTANQLFEVTVAFSETSNMTFIHHVARGQLCPIQVNVIELLYQVKPLQHAWHSAWYAVKWSKHHDLFKQFERQTFPNQILLIFTGDTSIRKSWKTPLTLCESVTHISSYCYSLESNYLQDTSCIQLASVIKNNRSLKKLVLSYNPLFGPHFSDLMEALSHPDCRIEELQLAFNNLSHTSCSQLASVIGNNPSLKILVLSDNRLHGRHFSDLMEALSSPDCRIEELRLDSNYLQDTSCIQLASVISNNPFLKKLVLSNNRLSGPHFSDLMEALSSPTCRIEELHLYRNDLSEEEEETLRNLQRNKPEMKIQYFTS